MSFIAIPLDTSGLLYYDELVPIEGVEYLFEFYWNARDTLLYLSLYDQDQNPIASGIPLVVNWNLLRRFRGLPNVPPGLLMAVDSSGNNLDAAAVTDYGNRIQLIYATSDDPALVGINLALFP
jgi:hypothetical protein